MPGRAIPWDFPGGGISLVALAWIMAGSWYIVKMGSVYILLCILFFSCYSKYKKKLKK